MNEEQFCFVETKFSKGWRIWVFLCWLARKNFTRKVRDYLEVVRRGFVNEQVVVENLNKNSTFTIHVPLKNYRPLLTAGLQMSDNNNRYCTMP